MLSKFLSLVRCSIVANVLCMAWTIATQDRAQVFDLATDLPVMQVAQRAAPSVNAGMGTGGPAAAPLSLPELAASSWVAVDVKGSPFSPIAGRWWQENNPPQAPPSCLDHASHEKA